MSGSSRGPAGQPRDVAFVGDVHLDRDDPDLAPFLVFLDRLRDSCSRIVLLGDLFNLWVGQRELEQPHQREVVNKLVELRHAGVVVHYLEGNRDYRIGACYVGLALDEASSDGLIERCGGRSVFAVHGDLANVADRSYRMWRRASRSALAWWLFRLMPRGRRLRLAEFLEARLRSTNLQFKRMFPEQMVRSYAASFLEAGHDIVVLGHFHVEKDLESHPPGPPGRILVLPDWKSGRRYLRIAASGEVAFVDSE